MDTGAHENGFGGACRSVAAFYFGAMHGHFILETKRLTIREFKKEDAHSFFELNADPEVIRYTGDEAFKSVAEARTFIDEYDHYRRYGYGRWAVELKASNAFIGFCGLRSIDDHAVDIGFRFHKRHWGKGYATESAKACLDFGFKRLGLKRIIGRAVRSNKASLAVLQKIGMVYSHDGDCHGMNAAIYVIENGT